MEKRRHDDRDDDQLGPQCFHRGIDGRDGGIHHDHDRLGAFVLSARGQNAVQQLLGGGGLGGCFALHGGGKLQELIVFQHGAAVFLRLPEQQRRLIGKQHVQDAGGLVAGGQYRGAVLPHDVDTDEILAGQAVHLGVEVLIIDAGGYFLGGIFNGAGLDGFVEALQKTICKSHSSISSSATNIAKLPTSLQRMPRWEKRLCLCCGAGEDSVGVSVCIAFRLCHSFKAVPNSS